MQKVIFIGANNPEVISLICDWENDTPHINDRKAVGFLDNNKSLWGELFYDYPVLGGLEKLPDLIDNYLFVNLITGSTKDRDFTSRQVLKAGGWFTDFIHPSVRRDNVFEEKNGIGAGIYIQAHVILQAEVEVGWNSAIHTGAIIAHECIIGESVFIAHGACLSGKVEVGEGAFIGANATILPRLKIGKWSTVGAGSVVTKDVPDYVTVVGNPARELIK